MTHYEYKVVPAPKKGLKAKGVKTTEGRFANSVESVLNQMGEQGWEYLRAELLPSDERTGLTGSTTNWRNILVFRRVSSRDASVFRPQVLASPEPPEVAPPAINVDAPADAVRTASGAAVMLKDNGVEELSEVSGMTASLKARAQQQSDPPENEAQAAAEESAKG